MRLLTANIEHAGVLRANRVADFVDTISPDIVAFTEVEPGSGAAQLDVRLRRHGYDFWSLGRIEALDLRYTIAIASRLSVTVTALPFIGTRFAGAALEVEIAGLTVVALYAPLNRKKPMTHDHDDFWNGALRPFADSIVDRPAIILGDWNTGAWPLDIGGRPVPGMAQFEGLTAAGWTDAWRTQHPGVREFSWFTHDGVTGLRLDHALLSPSLAPTLQRSTYRHETREGKVTDHSALVLDLDWPILDRA